MILLAKIFTGVPIFVNKELLTKTSTQGTHHHYNLILTKIKNHVPNDYSSNKKHIVFIVVYPYPIFTAVLVHILHFGGNTLNEKFNIFISNSNNSLVPASLCYEMFRGNMNYRL